MIKNKKILYICPKFFIPANDGAKIVYYNTVKELSKYNELDLITNISKSDFSLDTKEIKTYFKNFSLNIFDITKQNFIELFLSFFLGQSYFYRKYYNKKFKKIIEKYLSKNKYDIIWLETAYTTFFAEFIKNLAPNAKIISRSHNVEYLLLERMAEEEKNPLKKFLIKREAKFMKILEIENLKFVDKFLTITDFDREKFLQLNKKLAKKTGVLLPGVDFEKYEFSPLTKEKNLVFIGSMDYFPNITAIKWFVENVFSEISIFDPEIKLYIIGKNASKSIKNLATKNIIVEPGVNQDTYYYDKSRIFIVPLLSGSGLKLKVLNALAKGKPVISTKIGLEGIALENEKEVFCSDDIEAWKTWILQNIGKSETLEKMAKKARDFALKNFCWEKNFEDLEV